MKISLSTILCIIIFQFGYTQSGTINGFILNSNNNEGIAGISILIKEKKIMTFTNEEGIFSFENIPYGKYHLIINHISLLDTLSFLINDNLIVLDTLYYDQPTHEPNLSNQIYNNLDENNDDDYTSDNTYNSALTAFKDPIINTASYALGSIGYRLRGYKSNEQSVYINNININDGFSNIPNWNTISGLNDILKNQTTSLSIKDNSNTNGKLQSNTDIDITAMEMKKGHKLTLSNSNRNYHNRIAYSYHSGLLHNKWAWTATGTRRWAINNYIPGVDYDSWGFHLGISNKINNKLSIHLNTLGNYLNRGLTSSSTIEAQNLANDMYYNPNWGYQNNKIRNAKIRTQIQPLTILKAHYNVNEYTFINLSTSFQTGYHTTSSIDWYNAPDPRPDYYGYLPSFFTNNNDSTTYNNHYSHLISNPELLQIQWNKLYNTNNNNYDNNNLRRSLYIIGQDVTETQQLQIAASIQSNISSTIIIKGRSAISIHNNEYYKKAEDLLGGDYWININQFAERIDRINESFYQNDVNNPNQVIKKNDKYGYHYSSKIMNINNFIQSKINIKNFEFILGYELNIDEYSRIGHYQSGVYINESYGKSEYIRLLANNIKVNAVYKINGRNHIILNSMYRQDIPDFNNIFISPRVRNTTINNIHNGGTQSYELNYVAQYPKIATRISLFHTISNNQTKIYRFFHDDEKSFVNYVMNNINTDNIGGEMHIQYKILPFLTTTFSTYQYIYRYNSRPEVNIYRDNDNSKLITTNTIYWQNYYIGSGPQSAYHINVQYNGKQYWWISTSINYLSRNYIEPNPIRRTIEAVDLLDQDSEQYQKIISQQQLPDYWTLNLFTGKNIFLNKYFKNIPRNQFISMNLGVNNITNNRFITNAYEQLRYDYTNKNPEKFPLKVQYSQGINYFLNVQYRF